MMTKRIVTATLGAVAAAVGTGASALGWSIARKLTAPVGPRSLNVSVRGVERGDGHLHLVLDRTDSTIGAGIYNLWFERGGWVQLGSEIGDRGPELITRTVTGASDGLKPRTGDRAPWSGIYFASPADAGLEHRDIVVVTPAGHAPAWRIDRDLSSWAIHVHGLGSTRAGTLRGVQVATELGYTSLVVSYRDDGEGPQVGNGRSTLGVTEVDDVDAAFGYAIGRGAERIVLFGWSVGAAIVLQLAHRTEYRDLITGLVLDLSVLDWRSAIQANSKRVEVPSSAGNLAIPWLSKEPLARMVGLSTALPLEDFNWSLKPHELAVPTLILHGISDDSVPFATSEALGEQRPELVTLEAFDAGHTLSWNSDHQRWQVAVSSRPEQCLSH